jgi:hypothetical protein
MDALYHARSASRKWGGAPEEYLAIHEWFDESAAHVNDLRHRVIRHHSLGVAEAIQRFGRMLTLSNGKSVPVKQIAERHLVEDLGFVPTVGDWVRNLNSEQWMRMKVKRSIVF